jgi:acyl-CoA hydrolase
MIMEAKLIEASQVVMTQLVLPTHTNALGTVFGGTVMSWIDIAAAVCAQRHSQKAVVTASIDELHFLAPIYKGWVVNLKASINYVSRSSMEVGVKVESENPITGERFHTASAYLTFVALGSDGKSTAVAPLKFVTEDQKRRAHEAEVRKVDRLKRKEKYARK